MIKHYDPNQNMCDQVVEITLMQWDYKAVFRSTIGGNCMGLSIMESAIEDLYYRLAEEQAIGDDCPVSVTLTNAEGEELICEDDELMEDEWLKKMVVSIQIIERIKQEVKR